MTTDEQKKMLKEEYIMGRRKTKYGLIKSLPNDKPPDEQKYNILKHKINEIIEHINN